MQVKINVGDTILLSLGDGLYREVSYELLENKFRDVRQYTKTRTAAVSKATKLYDYAKREGKYTNGSKATSESLAKMRSKLIEQISELYPHERMQFKGWCEDA